MLEGVDRTVADGATALLGPSGSGKSSLLRLLNRLADPDAGCVRFRGQDVRDLDPLTLRRRAVLVPQLPAPLPGSVASNVGYGPGLLGRDVEPSRCLALAGLDESYAEREAGKLSVGEQQRVMLARALALEPEVLLLDEPTSALDEGARDAVEGALAGLAGLSMVIVTHDRAQAERLAERVVRLDAGRLVDAQAPEGAAER
ncbi:MAG TPA: ATP-binding cassette domain-containing protein [Thermoleophilaceae bacterium]|nr:ATP-binding cassette domain-containing protein [Thermoleophilaceae bacterium]